MFLNMSEECISSKRKADTALNPKTLPMIDAVKFDKEPSSNKSHSYAIKAKKTSVVFGTGSTR